MCRACVEGGRRCKDGWSSEKIEQETRAANARRRRNRSVRAGFASVVEERLGEDVRAAVMKTSPNQLSLVASRIADHSPETEEAIRTAIGGGQYPGTHNMVIQEIRSESSYTDHDRVGNLKNDPMNVSAAMHALNTVDAAALDKGLVPDGDRAALQRELDVRTAAVALGLDTPSISGPMTAEQAAFYNNLSVEEIEMLGRPNERLENNLRQEVFSAAQFDLAPRTPMLRDDETYLTAEELADRYPKSRMAKGVQVAEDVLLKRDPESGRLFYSVDGTHRLPAGDHAFVHDQVAKIPFVNDIRYDKHSGPAGQEAMFERLSSDGYTDMAVEEAAIRTVFESDRPAGEVSRLIESEDGSFDFDTLPNSGKARVTMNAMAATNHRRPGAFDATNPASPVANRHLRRAGLVRETARAAYAKKLGVGDVLSSQEKTRRARTGNQVGDSPLTTLRVPAERSRTPFDTAVADGLDNYTTARAGKPIRSAKNSGVLDTRAFSAGDVGNSDVDLAVARANGYASAGGPDLAAVNPADVGVAHDSIDTCTTADLAAYTQVRDAVEAVRLQRAVTAKQGGQAPKPVTMTAYTSLPEDLDVDTTFAPGGAFSPTRYVSTASNARRPRKAAGTRTVRCVYTSATGAQITPQRTIISPEQSFRVADKTVASDGTVTVHLVEDQVLAAVV